MRKQLFAVELLITLLGKLRHDIGKDLVAVEGAVVCPDLDRLHHLDISAGDRQKQLI